MASKRKSYRGTPAEHRREATGQAKAVLARLKAANEVVQRAKSQDDCVDAFRYIAGAENIMGRFMANLGHSGPRRTPFSTLNVRIERTKKAFVSKCLR
jgi:hypothetical protein